MNKETKSPKLILNKNTARDLSSLVVKSGVKAGSACYRTSCNVSTGGSR